MKSRANHSIQYFREFRLYVRCVRSAINFSSHLHIFFFSKDQNNFLFLLVFFHRCFTSPLFSPQLSLIISHTIHIPHRMILPRSRQGVVVRLVPLLAWLFAVATLLSRDRLGRFRPFFLSPLAEFVMPKMILQFTIFPSQIFSESLQPVSFCHIAWCNGKIIFF